jgi:hypothetical protein
MIPLSLGRLKPGMVLAEPVHNFQGMLLLDSGATLTGKHIQILKSWGVTKISVEGESQRKKSGDAGSGSEARLAVEKEMKKKFSEVMSDPVMMEIMRVAANVLEARALMREDADGETTR